MSKRLLTPLEFWTHATMRIDNQWVGHGTGFLVGLLTKADGSEGRIFFVTNKHVINPNKEKRESADKIALHFNIRKSDQSIVGNKLGLQFSYSNICREHPDPDVDILALEVTQMFVENPQIEARFANYNMFANPRILNEKDIKMGDEILVIGYPQSYPVGLRHVSTNLPLMRAGIISSHIGENLEDNHKESDGKYRKRILRGFLIDGAIIPGSSGSPVILKPTSTRSVRGQTQMQIDHNLLLGIVTETRYAYTEDFQSFAGLGLALNADAVKETIDLFLAH